METTNNTLVLEFVLKGFTGGPKVDIIIFTIIMCTFLVILVSNTVIIFVICTNKSLHLPMYIFLVSLSLAETLSNIFVIPKILDIIIAKQLTISRALCFTQSFFYFLLTGSCFLFLGIMSLDRYVAVCHPLRYATIMRKELCVQLVIGSMMMICFSLLYPTVMMSTLPFCGQVLDHLFCDGGALMYAICVDTTFLKVYGIITSGILLTVPLILTTLSYILIVSTVIKIPSKSGRYKTFSTCISHLTMVSVVFGSAIFIEVRPPTYRSVEANKVVSLGTTMLAPLVNPFIYTLRNKNVIDVMKAALRRNRIHTRPRMR
uniref:Olfactory receptor n=1 Tax=Pyxicephalus adspersus TaxID=30357 RepID=A0AAV3ADW3_PYXAD|nr:TPA: hypothetical protein GDO54_013598 [Pyxicephalus adspersus]